MLYKGGELSMVVLLPDPGRFEEFESALNAERLGMILDDLVVASLALALPRFTYESDFILNDVLKEMGMPDAFTPCRADFSGLDAAVPPILYISAVVHKAFVAVDESGTEAAAATAVVLGDRRRGPPPGLPVAIDRPFLFLIRDIPTGTLLFVGRVVDPTGESAANPPVTPIADDCGSRR